MDRICTTQQIVEANCKRARRVTHKHMKKATETTKVKTSIFSNHNGLKSKLMSYTKGQASTWKKKHTPNADVRRHAAHITELWLRQILTCGNVICTTPIIERERAKNKMNEESKQKTKNKW